MPCGTRMGSVAVEYVPVGRNLLVHYTRRSAFSTDRIRIIKQIALKNRYRSIAKSSFADRSRLFFE
jgi:hypothetical protein